MRTDPTISTRVVAMIGAALSALACTASAQPASTPEPARAVPPAQADAPKEATQARPDTVEVIDVRAAEDLLRVLERADERVRTLEADISYDRRFKLQGDRHVRTGRLFFERVPPGEGAGRARKAFAIYFDTLVAGDRKQDDPQAWAFDGRWLTEIRPAQKRWTKREIARAGEAFDPLRVGEGPMPLPIGQRADDILKRFEAELLPPEQGLSAEEIAGLPFVRNTWQLRLTPRPGAADAGGAERDEFREVRLWYAKDTLLPRLARTSNKARDESFVVLINLRLNAPGGLAQGVIAPVEPPEGQGWDKQVTELRSDPGGERGAGSAGDRGNTGRGG